MGTEDLKKQIAKAEQEDAFPLQDAFGDYIVNDAAPQDRDWYRWDEAEKRYVLVPCFQNVVVDTYTKVMSKAPKVGDVRNIEMNVGALCRIAGLRSPCVIDFDARAAKPLTGWVFAKNAVVVPKADGTVVTTPYTRRVFTVGRLPYAYDPAATCPTIDTWLEERLGDADAIRALWEFVGSCLEPGNRYKNFMVWVGEGNTGKTAAGNLVRAILGDENVSSLPANYLNVPSVTPACRYKLLNLSEEKTHLTDSCQETIKDWVSGGPTLYNPKYRSAYSEPATAKLLFAMNRMPLFTDTSRAIFNRATIISWDRIIPIEEAVSLEEMTRRFEPELPGALNRALAAKRVLDARGRALQPQASREVANDLYEQSNPYVAWFIASCEQRPNARVPCQVAYDDFCDWCDRAGVRPFPSIIEYGKGLRGIGVVEDKRIQISRKRQRTKDEATGKEVQSWAYEGFAIVHPNRISSDGVTI